jgi:hypothetical protein
MNPWDSGRLARPIDVEQVEEERAGRPRSQGQLQDQLPAGF